jgi:hypothetical protein
MLPAKWTVARSWKASLVVFATNSAGNEGYAPKKSGQPWTLPLRLVCLLLGWPRHAWLCRWPAVAMPWVHLGFTVSAGFKHACERVVKSRSRSSRLYKSILELIKSLKSCRKSCASVAWGRGGSWSGVCWWIRRIAQAQAGARIGFGRVQHQEDEIQSHWNMRSSNATLVKQYDKGTRRCGDDIEWPLRTLLRARDRGRRGEQVVPAEKVGPSRRP